MTIQLLVNPGQKCLELGGGDCPQIRPNWDCRPGHMVDCVVDFEKPLPSPDNEWQSIFSHFALEHVSWRNVPKFLAEVFRILVPGGKTVFAVPNTEAQLKWIQEHPEGWDNKGSFESCSEVLFGSLDYPENSHKSFWSPAVAHDLFRKAGFSTVLTRPYGERETDMLIEAAKDEYKPKDPALFHLSSEQGREFQQAADLESKTPITAGQLLPISPNVVRTAPATMADRMAESSDFRRKVFDKQYFNGGRQFGGYASDKWGAFRDFPVHHLTAKHILARRPKSVIEIGCGRGYVLKRIQDAGIEGCGLEISKHCVMTRCCKLVIECDLCETSWDYDFPEQRDLSYSVATLEHIPTKHLPAVIKEMTRVSKRGLHGIDFGGHDDGFDKSHVSLMPKEAWVELFAEHAPGWPVELVDKEELERGTMPEEVVKGDGKTKLNIGSHISMFHHGWDNLDVLNLDEFAQQNGYRFRQLDAREGLPYGTGSVSLIFSHHFLEHLTYKEGLSFLRECRRVIRPEDGCIRIVVPDAQFLLNEYCPAEVGSCHLSEFDEINDGCAASPTAAAKLYELLLQGHQAIYDGETLVRMMKEAGFVAEVKSFRQGHPQILKETVEFLPCLSLFVEGRPKTK